MPGLTVQGARRPGERRELLRWKEIVGQLYLSERPEPALHRAALKLLLQMRPTLAGQVETLGL